MNNSRTSTTSSPLSLPVVETVLASSGRRYRIQHILQDKEIPWGRVYLGTDFDEARKVILKEIPQDWDCRNEIYRLTAKCPNIRHPIDHIPEMRMLVFEHVEGHLLSFVQTHKMSLAQTKWVLRGTLEGICQLHALNVVHNDIKPNNILVQTTKAPSGGTSISKILITDLEDAAHLEPDEVLKGAQLGNFMWRSPEAHAGGPMEISSDMFAFGIVCMYAMTKTVLFEVRNPEADQVPSVLFKHLTHFGDDEGGLQGLLEYLGDNNEEMRDVLETLDEMLKDAPKNHMSSWDFDDDFKDLLRGLTWLDPRRRITAREALEHRWFAGV